MFDGDDFTYHVHFELKKYGKIQTYEVDQRENRGGEERRETIVCVAMEPQDDAGFSRMVSQAGEC